MSELQARQCHKCQGVMVPVRKTTYNFIASTYHYECTSCHAKANVPDVVTRFLQAGVGGALLFFGSADGSLWLSGIGALMLGFGLLAGRRNPILDLQALAAKVATLRDAEAAAFGSGTSVPPSDANPVAGALLAQPVPVTPSEKPRVMAPAAPQRRPTVERVGGFGRRSGSIHGVAGR